MSRTIITRFLCPVLLAVCTLTNAAHSQEKSDLPVRLNPHVEVTGETILLKDIFSGIKRYGDNAIAKSPAPGQDLSLPAMWLWRVAKMYRVDWKPVSKLDSSLVTRLGTRIEPEQITTLLENEIFERTGDDDLLEMEIDNAINEIYISSGSEPSLRMSGLNIDQKSGRFSTKIIAPAQGTAEAHVLITGVLHTMVEAAVPIRRILPGEIIQAGDLEWKRLRRRFVDKRAILDASQIIGLSAKRTLIEGRTIALNSVEPPVMVKRNGLVTVTLTTGNMQISTQGKALQNGTMDEIVQIRNLQSNIIIEALVSGPGKARAIHQTELALR